jgi:hypothetical protein
MKRFFTASIFCLVFTAVAMAQELRFAPLTTTASIPVMMEMPASRALSSPPAGMNSSIQRANATQAAR